MRVGPLPPTRRLPEASTPSESDGVRGLVRKTKWPCSYNPVRWARRSCRGAGAGQSGDDELGADVAVEVRPRHDDLAAGQDGDAIGLGHPLGELDVGLAVLAERWCRGSRSC